jgi:hypothetical protein
MNVINKKNNNNNNKINNRCHLQCSKKNYKTKHVCKTWRIRIPEAVARDQVAGKRNSVRPSDRNLDCNIGTRMGHEAQVLERMVVMMVVMIFVVTVQ